MRLLLGTHRPRFPHARVEKTGFQRDATASLDDFDLPACFIFHGLRDKAHRVDVLDLATRAERRTGSAHRHVHVGAHRTLFHVAVAGPEVAHNRAQLLQERGGLLA